MEMPRLYLFLSRTGTVRNVHSLQHPKPRFKPRTRRKPSAKPLYKPPLTYMRTTINKISNILRFSPWPSALKQLEKLDLKWDSYTINKVLRTHPPLQMAWEFFNWSKTLPKFKHDQFTYTTMLDIFGEAGRIDSMKALLQEMEEQGRNIDAATYTAVMHSLAKAGDIAGALQTWNAMKLKKCRPTVVSYTAIMKILFSNNRPQEAGAVYREMLEAGCNPNCYTYTVLIEYLADQGKFEEAFGIFTQMQELLVEPSKATCNILVQKCARAGETRLMVHVLKHMKNASLVLRPPIYMEALESLNQAGESDDLLREMHSHILPESKCCVFRPDEDDSSERDLRTKTDLILALLHERDFTAIESLLDEMLMKGLKLDARVLTAIIQACSTNVKPACAIKAYEYGKSMGIQLDQIAYASLIGFLMRSKLHQKVIVIVEEMIQQGINPGAYILSVLISRLGSVDLCEAAQKLFDTLPDEQNVATYTALLNALFKAGNVEKAIEIYESMKRKGIKATAGTYEVLQIGLEKAGRYQEAKAFKQQRMMLLNDARMQATMKASKSQEWSLCDIMFDNVSKDNNQSHLNS
eukprot:Gb_11322 [translate_table: standard]